MPGAGERKSSSPGVKLTYDDLALLPDDGKRHELVDGEHYVTPSPSTRHQNILGNLHFLLRSHLERTRTGRVFFAPYDIVFTQFDVVEPDLMYFSHARAAEVLTERHATGAPDLIVEVASKSTRKRDETIKRRLYEQSGVPEYWVVDPVIDVVRVYRLAAGRYGRPAERSREEGDALTTPLLEGFEASLSSVFQD